MFRSYSARSRQDALMLLHEDIGQGYKQLKNMRGQPCNKQRGWHGLRGACKRLGKGATESDRASAEKASKVALADKIRASKALGKLPKNAANWEKEWAAESSSVKFSNSSRASRLKSIASRKKAQERTIKNTEQGKALEGDFPGFSVSSARYAKGKLAVRPNDGKDGFKGNADRVAEFYGGKFSNRDRAYIMSPSSVRAMNETMKYAGKEYHETPYKHHAAMAFSLGQRPQKEALADPGNRSLHRMYVESAIKSGKSVPKEVLADYPDLVKKQ